MEEVLLLGFDHCNKFNPLLVLEGKSKGFWIKDTVGYSGRFGDIHSHQDSIEHAGFRNDCHDVRNRNVIHDDRRL